MRGSRIDQGIGIFDSGVGGITAAKEVIRQLPQETIYYFADTKRLPYGPRSKREVRAFTEEAITYLLRYPLKAIIIACNTATAASNLPYLQERFSIPILGVIEPGARAAVKSSCNGKIGVIGTQGTIRSAAYEYALKQINSGLEVYSLACPDFVPLIEKGFRHTKLAEKTVRKQLVPFHKTEIDTLILGCTHYPLLSKPISKVLGPNVSLICSAEETVSELRKILQKRSLLTFNEQPKHRFFSSGNSSSVSVIAKEWLNRSIEVEQVDLQPSKETMSKKSS